MSRAGLVFWVLHSFLYSLLCSGWIVSLYLVFASRCRYTHPVLRINTFQCLALLFQSTSGSCSNDQMFAADESGSGNGARDVFMVVYCGLA